jgi:hypothetical protein
MSFDAETLYHLLPAIYRLRDAEQAARLGSLLAPAELAELDSLRALPDPSTEARHQLAWLEKKASRGPMESLLAVFAEQVGVVEENLEQLYDDLFIETCADWVVPYIGDLIGYQSLHGVVPEVASPRAEVAHTIALRRRKGTATGLEQIARDVTGWHARVVEFFQVLVTTQYMNHARPFNVRCPDLRDGGALEWLGTAFESTSRSVDVRRIASGRGRHNIPNVGLFLWRIDAYPHTDSPAVAVQGNSRCYRVSPLNHDVPLYGRPRAETEITHLADPLNVPLPLSRRRLQRHLGSYYGGQTDGSSPSLVLKVNGAIVARDSVDVCNLSGVDAAWGHMPPPGRYAIDPQLGRVALPPDTPEQSDVRLTWHEGFTAGAHLGGGEYDRGAGLPEPASDVKRVRVPAEEPTLAKALDAIAESGVKDAIVLISDSGRYEESQGVAVRVPAGGTVEIRGDNFCQPTLVLSSPMTVTGGDGASCVISGLRIAGAPLVVPTANDNALAGLRLTHCTLVPGLALDVDGEPLRPAEPSLLVTIPGITVDVERSILGGVRVDEQGTFEAVESIIDATDKEGVAFAAPDGLGPGARFSLEACTVVGKVHAREFGTLSNSLVLAAVRTGDSDWRVPVRTERRQVGCVRFTFLPFDSVGPKRYRCQPDSAEAARQIVPRFTSLRYGTPTYCQLATSTPDAVRRGAEDEREMGVFRHLSAPQRETNLLIRLREHLRVGLEAGIIYES